MAKKVAIIYLHYVRSPIDTVVNCRRYGHIKQMADAEAEGVREAGLEVDMYQYVPLSQFC